MNIEFPEREFIVAESGQVNMIASVDGKEIVCTIFDSALTDIDPSNRFEDKEVLFNKYKHIYQLIARKKIIETEAKSNVSITFQDVIAYQNT